MKKRELSLYEKKGSPQDPWSKITKVDSIIFIRMYWEKNNGENKDWDHSILVGS